MLFYCEICYAVSFRCVIPCIIPSHHFPCCHSITSFGCVIPLCHPPHHSPVSFCRVIPPHHFPMSFCRIVPPRHSAASFQLHVEARRQFEVTEQIAETVVNITVTRNEYAPRFAKSEYRVEKLSEKTAVGETILTVSATDRDGVRPARLRWGGMTR